MSDDRFLIPHPPGPEPTQPQQHPRDKRMTITAIVIAGIAALISGLAAAGTAWQAWEAHLARSQAQQDAIRQAQDVERARIAAEKSAASAERSADAAWRGVSALGDLVDVGKTQIQNTQRMFAIEREPDIGWNGDGKSMGLFVDPHPRMVANQPTSVTISLINTGGPASKCKIGTGGGFSNTGVPTTPQVLFPGLVGLAKGSSLSFVVEYAPLDKQSAVSGDYRIYITGTADCKPAVHGMRPYHSQWCFYFPILKDGTVQDFQHGCTNPEEERTPQRKAESKKGT